MKASHKIGLGGGCHWCTEAVFQQLKGVQGVEQGYISSDNANFNLSEAIIVHFEPKLISLAKLIEIHLYTHQSTSNHSFRKKYRSAVYYFTKDQKNESVKIITALQEDFSKSIVTKVLKFNEFESSREEIQNYYSKDPNKPFCKIHIEPKLQILLKQFKDNLNLNDT